MLEGRLRFTESENPDSYNQLLNKEAAFSIWQRYQLFYFQFNLYQLNVNNNLKAVATILILVNKKGNYLENR